MASPGQVLRYRWSAQQLDAEHTEPTELAVLDLGIQHGAGEAVRTALLNRGVPVAEAIRLTADFSDELAQAWTVRGAPHFYRRTQIEEVQTAVSPFSMADAAKRSVNAGRQVEDCLAALTVVATEQRAVLDRPRSKGEVSTLLQDRLPAELQVACRSCAVTHCHEQLFRLAALHGGIELQPGTSPPVLRRIPNWRRTPGPAADPLAAPAAVQPVRGYLHLLGPATPKDLAAYLETTVAEVKAGWPEDVAEVDRAGERAWLLADDVERFAAAEEPAAEPSVRLLNGFDLFLAAKDRHLLTGNDKTRHKQLWPVLGRPGAIVADGELLGTWRPRTRKGAMTVECSWWTHPTRRIRALAEVAGEGLASVAGRRFAGIWPTDEPR